MSEKKPESEAKTQPQEQGEGKPPKLPAGYLKIARQEGAALCRVMGLGNMHVSYTLCDFITNQFGHGGRNFAIDLKECTGMDSTFMGGLVGLNEKAKTAGGWICLLNVSEVNRKLLEMIGVWGIVPVKEAFALQEVETETLLPEDNPKARIKHIKRAHEHLVKVDERNRERFGRFLQTLEEEMNAEASSEAVEEVEGELVDMPEEDDTPHPSEGSSLIDSDLFILP